MGTSDFPEIWKTFANELDTRYRRLYSEIEASWNSLDTLLQKHAEKISSEDWKNRSEGNLDSILDLAKKKGSLFLFEPLFSLKKARPQERALHAIDSFQSGIEDILRLLPKSIVVSRSDLEGCLDWKGNSFRHILLRLSQKPVTLNLRSIVHQVLLEHSAVRAKLDGRMLLLQARATLSLLIPWQFMRNDTLRTLGGNQSDPQNLLDARFDWLRMLSAFKTTGTRLLTSYGIWKGNLSGRFTSALLAGDRRLSAQRIDRTTNRWQNCFRYWAGRQRVLVAQLELETTSGHLLETAAGISRESLSSVDEEHAQLLSELDKVSKWLEDNPVHQSDITFPPPEARLVSSDDRTLEWMQKLEASGRKVLPVQLESVDLRRALPWRRKYLKSIAAEACFVKSLSDIGRGIAFNGYSEAVEGHRAIVREIERAREVAAYSIEVGRSDSQDEESRQVVRDGITNALSLLAYQKKSVTDYHPVVEHRLTEAVASTFFQFHIRTEESRLGFFTYFARQKSHQAVRSGAQATLSRIKTGSVWLRDRIAQLNRFLLIKFGWSPPSAVSLEPVTRREYLGELLNLKAGPRELPAIYRRLFRLAPVEDQRFLVGREAEMAAAAQARRLWEEGRSVAILVAGARGSGKTSFLNCACSAVFGDIPIVSGQFGQRITTAQSMHAFLSSLVQTDVRELDRYFKSDRRLVVLEEVERTFLRCVGGFQGLKALLSLISTTSRNTLWVLSLNETALRFLTRIVAMEEYFSHRINAMAVSPPHLRNAILLRHNLSGLRLHFAEPPSFRDTRNKRVRQLFGFDRDTEQIFFESLYSQSEGIFRSAFELWQQSVDRVEGGVLYMLNPTVPDYEKMISKLTLEDAFMLHAILQHGSLTTEEISQVFDYGLEKSNSRIEKMIAWEIIEPDPNNPGFRIRPEAGRVVREVLYRQNLL